MRCQTVKKKLSAYMDEALRPDERKLVMQHLKTCKNCAFELKKLEAVWDALGILPEIEAAPYFYPRLKTRMASFSKNGRPIWKKQLWIPFASAAVLLAGIFLGQTVGDGFNGNGSSQVVLGESYSEDELMDAFNDFPSSSMGDIYIDWIDYE